MTENLKPEMLDAWRGVLFAQAHVVQALEADMLEQHGLPITWFDVLSRLSDAPHQRMRMHELEAASIFTRSGITALADRLENAGLVRRERSAEDRRGVYLAITEAGLNTFAEVWPDHKRSIQEHFGQYLDTADAKALSTATQKILNPGAE